METNQLDKTALAVVGLSALLGLVTSNWAARTLQPKLIDCRGPEGSTRMLIYDSKEGIVGEYVFLIVNDPANKVWIKYYPRLGGTFVWEIIPYEGQPIIVFQDANGTHYLPKAIYEMLKGVIT